MQVSSLLAVTVICLALMLGTMGKRHKHRNGRTMECMMKYNDLQEELTRLQNKVDTLSNPVQVNVHGITDKNDDVIVSSLSEMEHKHEHKHDHGHGNETHRHPHKHGHTKHRMHNETEEGDSQRSNCTGEDCEKKNTSNENYEHKHDHGHGKRPHRHPHKHGHSKRRMHDETEEEDSQTQRSSCTGEDCEKKKTSNKNYEHKHDHGHGKRPHRHPHKHGHSKHRMHDETEEEHSHRSGRSEKDCDKKKSADTNVHIHINLGDQVADLASKKITDGGVDSETNKEKCIESLYEENQYAFARCDMIPNRASETTHNISGSVFLKQALGQPINIRFNLRGFDVQKYSDTTEEPRHAPMHGIHVHEYGDLSDGCTSFGGHYNPGGHVHGGPYSEERHVGDWGNIECDHRGVVQASFNESMSTLFGPESIVGRGIVIHAHADDLGQGGTEASRASGDAGGRIACCVISFAKDVW